MNLREALAPLEAALLDHHAGCARGPLRLRFDDGRTDEVDPAWFFRPAEALDAIDRAALERATPHADAPDRPTRRVLDVGAGAGVHALPLQERGCRVSALEILPGAVRIMRERGVRDARLESVWDHRPDEGGYDAVLLLMNGTGVAGTLPRLNPLLTRVRGLLRPGGRVLIDSTDLGTDDSGGGWGELQIQLEYAGRRGAPFPHLYVDAETLAEHAAAAGLSMEVVRAAGAEEGRYLAELRGDRA